MLKPKRTNFDMYQNNTSVFMTSVSEQYTDMSTWRTYNATSAQEPLVLPRDIADNFTPLEINFIIINCVLNPILLLVGVPANIISCLVFYKQGLRDRMNLCLFVLALVDMVCVSSTFVVGIDTVIKFWSRELEQEYNAHMVVNFSFLVFGMRATSGCITMVIAVERCVCVVFPLRANSIMRTRTMGALLAITFIIMHLGFSVMFFRNKVESVYDKTRNQVLYRVTPREGFRKYNFILWDIVYTIIFSFVVPIVTFVVVGVATAVTVIKLRTAIAWRASTSSGGGADNQNQQQQVALTKMLVILSGVFMVCTAPLTSLSIVRLLLPDFSSYGRYSVYFFTAYEICFFLSAINSSANFFVYYARSSRFRTELRAMFRRVNISNLNPDITESNTNNTPKYGADSLSSQL